MIVALDNEATRSDEEISFLTSDVSQDWKASVFGVSVDDWSGGKRVMMIVGDRGEESQTESGREGLRKWRSFSKDLVRGSPRTE